MFRKLLWNPNLSLTALCIESNFFGTYLWVKDKGDFFETEVVWLLEWCWFGRLLRLFWFPHKLVPCCSWDWCRGFYFRLFGLLIDGVKKWCDNFFLFVCDYFGLLCAICKCFRRDERLADISILLFELDRVSFPIWHNFLLPLPWCSKYHGKHHFSWRHDIELIWTCELSNFELEKYLSNKELYMPRDSLCWNIVWYQHFWMWCRVWIDNVVTSAWVH